MTACIYVGIGGFIGSVLRYLIGLIPLKTTHGFPLLTLSINILGAFLIGFISIIALKKSMNPHLVLLLKTGLCGGFTTQWHQLKDLNIQKVDAFLSFIE
jgi:CrcB protein